MTYIYICITLIKLVYMLLYNDQGRKMSIVTLSINDGKDLDT